MIKPGFIRRLSRLKMCELLDTKVGTNIEEAVCLLKQNKPVAIPTETVYGLAANALSAEAAKSIFAAKNRPTDNPLIVHISSMEMLKMIVRLDDHGLPMIPQKLLPVLDRFWPGPLTVLLPKGERVPLEVTGGLETVAVRFPRHPMALSIIDKLGFPLAAPSANLSGRPSPTTAQHVLDDLAGRVELIVDGGRSSFGLESTVLDALASPPCILRPGSVTKAMLTEYLSDVQIYKAGSGLEDRPPTPGLKYRHYAPESPVVLCYSTDKLESFVSECLHGGKSIIRLVNDCKQSSSNSSLLYSEIVMSESGCKLDIARNLFDSLRSADSQRPHFIVAEAVEEEDEGLAIMNRLVKAASMTLY